jgi:hypothetical protein
MTSGKSARRNICVVALLLASAGTATAIINPNFTPIHLIEQAETIVQLSLEPSAGQAESLTGKPLKAHKGKAPAGPVAIDLSKMPENEAKEVSDVVRANPGLQAMLFVGGGDQAKVYLHLAGRWVELARAGDAFKGVSGKPDLEATWAGGTEMLIRAVEYAVSDPQAEFPVVPGIRWHAQQKSAVIEGRVFSARAISLDGKPPQILHLGAERGDRLFACPAGKTDLVDVTARHKMTARSAVSTWGFFNRDDRPDLASWDGNRLTIHLQNADGTFREQSVDTGQHLKSGCLGLAVIDGSDKGSPALLASTPDRPVIIVMKDGAAPTCTALSAPADDADAAGKDPGTPAACLVADFDGDGTADVLQMFPATTLFHRGTGPAAFAAPTRLKPGCGPGGKAFAGDFDADGRLDIFCTAQDRCRLWENSEGLAFREVLDKSGEAAYKCDSGGIGGMTCDFNNDGRQDLLLLYGPMGPQLFFNRGFRSFGYGLDICPTVQNMDTEDAGQQAGCLGDFNGDGTQDMALVLRQGELMSFFHTPDDFDATALLVSLPADGSLVGPVTVTGYSGKRCLGAWSVVAGSAEALFGAREPGEIQLQWRLPGGRTAEHKVQIEAGGQHRFVIRAP